MLEQQLLVLRPQPAPTPQTLVEAVTGAPLGFTRWRTRSSWLTRWLVGPILEVREHEDEPLLFTVRRCWSFAARYLVCDAEDSPVGVLDRSFLLDRLGRLFTVRQREGERVVFRTTSGCPVAEAESVAETVRLSFHAVVENQPFAKMLLLAAVLNL
jgi:hypothetical protein